MTNKNIPSDKLLPCPFCGGEAVKDFTRACTPDSGGYYLHKAIIRHDCIEGLRVGATNLFYSKKENPELFEEMCKDTIKAWNTRAGEKQHG